MIAGPPPAPDRHDAAASAANTRSANRCPIVIFWRSRFPLAEARILSYNGAGARCSMPRMLAHSPVDVITLDVAPAPAAPPEPVERPVRWRLRTRIAFRLCFLYFSLYVITTQMLGSLLILPMGSL